jgi:3-phosphoshikimate 1-carboxyvinyltransferase
MSDRLRGELRLPGDKSMSHRALLYAALANGETLVVGAGDGHDVRSTAGIISALGASVVREPTQSDDAPGTARWRVRSGGPDALRSAAAPLDCGNSGTSMRLGAGLVAGVHGVHTLIGDPSLQSRPMARVLEPLAAMGATAVGSGETGTRAPLTITGGTLNGIDWAPATPSAQVKGCVLLAALAATGESTYRERVTTRDHSERMLKARGAALRTARDASGTTITIAPSDLAALPVVTIPGDPSSATFWLVAGSLHPDADLLIRGVSLNPTRRHAIDLLQRMGARIDEFPAADNASGEPVGDLRVRSAALRGIEMSPTDVALAIDEVPILSLAAAMATGATSIRGAGELRAKESDRIAGVAAGLAAIGLTVSVTGDDLHFVGGGRPVAGTTASLGDHRLAMTFAIAALVSGVDVSVDDPGAAAVSYPTFYEDVARIRAAA